jgi:opacity protein-like surface antigen
MKRLVSCCSVLAVLVLVSSTAKAQRSITGMVGLGADIATSDYKDADSAKTGYQLMAGLECPLIGSHASLRVDGMVGWNARVTEFRESTYLANGNLHLVLWVPLNMPSFRPYLIGGAGLMYNKYNPGQTVHHAHSKTETVYGGGAGAEIGIAGVKAFVEGRYDYGADLTRIIPVIVGLRFNSGS